MIDWSFSSMARYLLTADPADPADRADSRVLPGSAWDGFLERLAEAGRLVTDGQQGSVHPRFLPPAFPGAPARPHPRQVTRLQRC